MSTPSMQINLIRPEVDHIDVIRNADGKVQRMKAVSAPRESSLCVSIPNAVALEDSKTSQMKEVLPMASRWGAGHETVAVTGRNSIALESFVQPGDSGLIIFIACATQTSRSAVN